MPKAIKEALAGEADGAMQDGGEEPSARLPRMLPRDICDVERKCALCQAQVQHDCERCGGSIPASEMMTSPYCSYCQHMYAKMLAE